MAADALHAYLTDRANHKDALLVCDTWEMADALNHRVHDTLTAAGPTVKAAREHHIGVGDVIISRANDPTIALHPKPESKKETVDQVRNGNRWRVAGIDTAKNRIAAERLTDGARTVFDGDYLINHITLGYATTVHAAQGLTVDTCHAILSENTSRAMAYVAMTRGRHDNHAYLYQQLSHEADHDHATPIAAPQFHQLRRGDKYCAAGALRTILANDDRPTTMHTQAERTPPELLTGIAAETLQRNQQRRTTRRAIWKEHIKTVEAWHTGYERIAAAATRSAEVFLDTGGLEL